MAKPPGSLNLKKLDLSCVKTDCEHGLHAFRPTASQPNRPMPCRECGAEPPADIQLLRAHDPSRLAEVQAAQRQEWIRQIYWVAPLDQGAASRLAASGYDVAMESIPDYLAMKMKPMPARYDAMRTPWVGDVRNYARHATATCCRRCLNYWFGVDRDHPLTRGELDWATTLVRDYLRQRRDEFEVAPTLAFDRD
jgi:hypothetical protein